MTSTLLLAAFLVVEMPSATSAPAPTVFSMSPLRASIARAAASVTLTKPAPNMSRAAGGGVPRCNGKTGAVAGAVIGAFAFGLLAHQANLDSDFWPAVGVGAGIGALGGFLVCSS